MGTGLLATWVRRHTQALRQRAEELETTVVARTAELAEKNRELTRLNRLESEEKIAARLAEEKARLEVLRYQLNPHFLFNTLASISGSLPAGASAARGMVERLAHFCRLTLHRGNDDEWTTLGEEMTLLRAYLAIEQSRWGELLDVEIAGVEALAGERLPHFLLLPLVENALKYGCATSAERVGVRLAASRAVEGELCIEVANTGEWVEPRESGRGVPSLGIGLENVRERLRRYYPHAHRLDVVPGDGWVRLRLHLGRPGIV
jgi:LytS/YehU family sensor histidine kinase